MKKSILILLVSFSSLKGYSQDLQKQIDSLKIEIKLIKKYIEEEVKFKSGTGHLTPYYQTIKEQPVIIKN